MDETTNRREFVKCITCASLGLMAGGLGCSKTKQSKETEMKEILAFCGIPCHECGAFLATQADEDTQRKKVAEEWSRMYNSDIKPEDINCEGCTPTGNILFNHCRVCEIRKCALEMGVVNCAHCESYPCDKLAEFQKMVPQTKQKLDEIKNTLL